MQEMVAEYLLSQQQRLPAEAEVRFVPERLPQPCSLPEGEEAWEVLPSNPNVFSSSSFSLIVRIDGRTVCNQVIRGKVVAMAPVAVSTRSLQRGDTIGTDGLRMSRQDLSRLRQPFFRHEDVIGRIATRAIPSGTVIEARDVGTPPVIKKGELVKLVTGGVAFHLSTTAVATTNGASEDVIPVRNLNSNKVVHARVTGPGIVTVEH